MINLLIINRATVAQFLCKKKKKANSAKRIFDFDFSSLCLPYTSCPLRGKKTQMKVKNRITEEIWVVLVGCAITRAVGPLCVRLPPIH